MNVSNSHKYKIAIITNDTNPAVCSSLMMHVNMISACGHSITIVALNKIDSSYFGDCKYKILNYSSSKELKTLLRTNSFDKILCISSTYVLYLTLIGIKLPIYLWMQGDLPAESYMRNHNIFRKIILQLIVAFSLIKTKGVIYVSDTMKNFYESKYRITPKNSIVIPCLSEFKTSKYDIKRIPNSFVYIGGLSVWQCFDETLNIYKKLRTDDSIFHIITHDTNEAKRKVDSIIGDFHNIKIYCISNRALIPETLSQFQYGFLIRKNDDVNLVSSPIKFLEYISCGVNVIMTEAVPSYADIVKQYQIGSIANINGTVHLHPYNEAAQIIYNQLFNHDKYIQRYYSFLLH